MKITFDTESTIKVPNTRNPAEQHVLEYELRKSSEIAFSLFYLLHRVNCQHVVELVKITYKGYFEPPLTKFNPCFHIVIDLARFGYDKVKISFEWSAENRNLIFESEQPNDIYDFPIRDIGVETIQPLDVAMGLLNAVALTIDQKSNSLKERAEKLTFIQEKIAKIKKF